MKDYIAFFDLDHTILETTSSKVMGMQAFKQGIFSKRNLIEGMFLSVVFKFNLMEGDKIIARMIRWLKGKPEQKIVNFTSRSFDDVLKKTIRKDAIREIEYHKNNNALTVILSASVSFLCKPILQYLGMDHIICTDLEIHNNKYTGLSNGKFCFGMEKLILSEKFCEKHNYRLNSAFFYTDSVTDLPMLEAVGYPVCVTPDKKLAAIAQKKGWEVCNWHNNK